MGGFDLNVTGDHREEEKKADHGLVHIKTRPELVHRLKRYGLKLTMEIEQESPDEDAPWAGEGSGVSEDDEAGPEAEFSEDSFDEADLQDGSTGCAVHASYSQVSTAGASRELISLG